MAKNPLQRYIVPLKIKHVNNPRARSLEGWDQWRTRLRRIYPVYWFFNEIVIPEVRSWGHVLSRLKWWFIHRLHPKHRYHVMNSRLKPDYYCFDTVLLHAAFERFCDEYPHTKEIVMLEKNVEAELDRLFKWWKEGRPAQEKEVDQSLTDWHDEFRAENPGVGISKMKRSNKERVLFKRHMNLETKLYNDDTKNLISLVRLKNHVSW